MRAARSQAGRRDRCRQLELLLKTTVKITLLESIALQSQCYEAIDLQSVRMDDGPDDSLLVTTKCELTITETMLYCGFPNLIKYGKWSALVDKMLGKKIVIHGSTHSFWDHASGRVRRLQWKADILTPLRRLLGV
ncbi:hypothetical protein Pcac1_g15109 [Phytophthora cactorum]|nr:hypothetical protein Pcac1_g15109 [Phytophthora cactorum]